MVRSEELFTFEELKRAGGRLKANTAPGIDGLPNEILREVIRVYPEILMEVFNSHLWEGRFFADWKKQRLVLLRKVNKPLGDPSSYGPICLLDTMGKLLEEMILQRLQSHMVRENAEYTFFVCARCGAEREAFGREVGAQLTPARGRNLFVPPLAGAANQFA